MAEQTIIRIDTIVVDTIGTDPYDNLTFTDKAGKEYKISAKRKQYFEKVIIPEAAVQLSYAMSSFGKEYIYKAELVSGKLLDVSPEAAQSQKKPIKTEVRQEVSKPKPITSRDEEEIRTRSSIEAQVAFKGAIELLVAKIIGIEDIFANAALGWGLSKINGIQIGHEPIEIKLESPVKDTPDKTQEITAETVIANFALLYNKKLWTIDKACKLLEPLGATGVSVRDRIKSLTPDKLLEFDAEVKEALKNIKQ